jgi:hypothetical protein
MEREQYVKAVLKLARKKKNAGFTSDEFFKTLEKKGLPTKKREYIGNRLKPDPRNDLVETAKSAALNWGVLLFHHSKARKNVFFVDKRTAKCLGIPENRPKDAVIYAASKRGFQKRTSLNLTSTVNDVWKARPVETAETAEETSTENIKTVESAETLERVPTHETSTQLELNVDFGESQVNPELQPTLAPMDEDELNLRTEIDTLLDDEFDKMEKPVVDEEADFSIDDCIPLPMDGTADGLAKFSYEKRFYFPSTFLHREGLLERLDIVNLMEFRKAPHLLLVHFDVLKDRYKNRTLVQDKNGNSLQTYWSALEKSFLFPLNMDQTQLYTYWATAASFHCGKKKHGSLLKTLKDIRPLTTVVHQGFV